MTIYFSECHNRLLILICNICMSAIFNYKYFSNDPKRTLIPLIHCNDKIQEKNSLTHTKPRHIITNKTSPSCLCMRGAIYLAVRWYVRLSPNHNYDSHRQVAIFISRIRVYVCYVLLRRAVLRRCSVRVRLVRFSHGSMHQYQHSAMHRRRCNDALCKHVRPYL